MSPPRGIALAGLAVLLAPGCALTRGRFEDRRRELGCALSQACAVRTCKRLQASEDPDERRLHALTCPPRARSCAPPGFGGWSADGPPPSRRCFAFDAARARRCLAALEAQLRVSRTAPLTDRLWCWSTPTACSDVFRKHPWPRCPLVY